MAAQTMIGVIDYGAGNLASVMGALERLEQPALRVREPGALEAADRIILPGVGAFGRAMRRLSDSGLADALRAEVARGKRLLGVCLGMQLLADESEEFGRNVGLGLIPGRVERLRSTEFGERTPHVGWNDVEILASEGMFDAIKDGACFYHVHSYHFTPARGEVVAARCAHGHSFVTAVASGRIWGVQFHPEKSQRQGLQLLRNFADAD